MSDTPDAEPEPHHSLLLPVLPLGEVCLFPGASLALVAMVPASVRAVEMAARTGGRLLALGQKPGPVRELHGIGTVAQLVSHAPLNDGSYRVELDGFSRARVRQIMAVEPMVAEAEPLEEGDPGEDWGPAVEALARYLHAHAELRGFLQEQRRSQEPMAWVNLACQHLPITSSARQRLLEALPRERCLKISRGLDALLKKEQAPG